MSPLQKAVYLTAKQGSFSIRSAPIPKPGPRELLIKIAASSLNPVDWKVQTNGIIITDYPAVLGTDIAGTVEEVGDDSLPFAKGDRVLTQGYFDNAHAAFQQYTLANADVTAKIPPNITFDEAATIPVGLATAALGLYTQLIPPGADFGSAHLTPPWQIDGRGKYAGKPFVVFGASSSVGQFAVQLAKLSGFSPIITTASLHNTELLISLGATHVIDRHLPASSLSTEIAKITSQPLEIIFDGVSLPATQNAAYDVLTPGGCLVTVLYPRINIDPARHSERPEKRVVKAFGQVNFPPENRAVSTGLYQHLTALLTEGAIKPNKVKVVTGGLEGVAGGLELLRNDAVSGRKLVVHPQETP